MFSFKARFNLRISKTASCWSIIQDKYKYPRVSFHISWDMRSAASTSLARISRFGCLGRTFCRSSSASTAGPRPQTSTWAISKEESWKMRKSPRWVIKKKILYGYIGEKSYLELTSSYQTFDIWIHRKVSMSPLDRPELRSASSSKPKLPENNFVPTPFWRKKFEQV